MLLKNLKNNKTEEGLLAFNRLSDGFFLVNLGVMGFSMED